MNKKTFKEECREYDDIFICWCGECKNRDYELPQDLDELLVEILKD